MVSEPTSTQPVHPESAMTDKRRDRDQPASAVPEKHKARNVPPGTPVTQPRWMTISVALTGIIGLVLMIILVRG
jgi:hypothetical protein